MNYRNTLRANCAIESIIVYTQSISDDLVLNRSNDARVDHPLCKWFSCSLPVYTHSCSCFINIANVSCSSPRLLTANTFISRRIIATEAISLAKRSLVTDSFTWSFFGFISFRLLRKFVPLSTEYVPVKLYNCSEIITISTVSYIRSHSWLSLFE